MEKRTVTAVIGTIIVILLIAAGVTYWYINENASNTEKVSLEEYYSVPEGEMLMFLNYRRSDRNALYRDGVIYVPFSLVQGINERFFWDKEENMLIFTTATEVFRMCPDEPYLYQNDMKIVRNHPVLLLQDDLMFIELAFAEPYLNLKYTVYEAPDRILLQYTFGDFLAADVTEDTQLREDHDKMSRVLTDLPAGTRLLFYDAGGIQENGYVMVLTEDGICGYVRTKDISESYYVSLQSEYTEPEYPAIARENSVSLGWHQVITEDGNKKLESLYALTEGMNVISPTWFNVGSNDGTLISRADISYVERAHELGLEVWGLFSNFHPNSAESVEIDCMELLSDYTNRTNLISEIMKAAAEYNLDGVNIDFETLEVEEGPYFIQFLRELSVKCRNSGLVLSVDNYVPANYNAFYDLEEQGKVVDYVIIMAYDEHYVGSEAGSVASLQFVADAATNTLAKVPADKVIMAIPFYTRLWTETTARDGSVSLTSKTLGIYEAEVFLRDNSISTTWQADTGQFYGEDVQGDVKYRIWLEDAMSIEEKMKVIKSNELAGVAAWQLGMETSYIWDVIVNYLN